MPEIRVKDVLITRSQMLRIAKEYRMFISLSTIHRWANEPDFPLVVGQNGRNLLYARKEYISFLERRLARLQEAH